MNIVKILKRVKPHFSYNNKIIFSKYNEIFEYENGHNKKTLLKLKGSWLEKLFFKSKLLSRLFRLDIRSSTIYKNYFFFSYRKKIYSYHVVTKNILQEHKFRKGRGPISFTEIDNLKGFSNSIVFGEYYSNSKRDKIHIYKRNNDCRWDIIYTFEKGLINHIHAIITDKFRDCLWVLAGDLDHSASIWMIKDNFEFVKRIAHGDQIYRSCYAYPVKEGLIYATDTQFSENSIRLLRINEIETISEELYKINGSCINACELRDYLVFSTEPNFSYNNKLMMYLDNRPGNGIKANKSDIVVYHKTEKVFEVIGSLKKDCLPYGLFGLGTIMFPNNMKDMNKIYAFSSGSKIYDQDTLIIKI